VGGAVKVQGDGAVVSVLQFVLQSGHGLHSDTVTRNRLTLRNCSVLTPCWVVLELVFVQQMPLYALGRYSTTPCDTNKKDIIFVLHPRRPKHIRGSCIMYYAVCILQGILSFDGDNIVCLSLLNALLYT
jgi:hypothetical protein